MRSPIFYFTFPKATRYNFPIYSYIFYKHTKTYINLCMLLLPHLLFYISGSPVYSFFTSHFISVNMNTAHSLHKYVVFQLFNQIFLVFCIYNVALTTAEYTVLHSFIYLETAPIYTPTPLSNSLTAFSIWLTSASHCYFN